MSHVCKSEGVSFIMLNIVRDTFLMKTSFRRYINIVVGNCTLLDSVDIQSLILALFRKGRGCWICIHCSLIIVNTPAGSEIEARSPEN